MSVKLLALTGPTGAGKSLVGNLLASHGIPVIDTDAVYHNLLTPPSACLDKLTEVFGNSILNGDGSLSRPKLAAIVYADKNKMAELNLITHTFIHEKVLEICSDYEAKGILAVAVDAPTLFDSPVDWHPDFILSVLADTETRKTRIMSRDGISASDAEKRIRAQHSDLFYIYRSDFVLYNNACTCESALAALEKPLDGFLEQCRLYTP